MGGFVQVGWNVQDTTTRSTEFVPVAETSDSYKDQFLKVNYENDKMKTIKEGAEDEEEEYDDDEDHRGYFEADDDFNERDDFDHEEEAAIQSRYNKLYSHNNGDEEDEEDKAYEEEEEEEEPDEEAFEEYERQKEKEEFGESDSEEEEEKSTSDSAMSQSTYDLKKKVIQEQINQNRKAMIQNRTKQQTRERELVEMVGADKYRDIREMFMQRCSVS